MKEFIKSIIIILLMFIPIMCSKTFVKYADNFNTNNVKLFQLRSHYKWLYNNKLYFAILENACKKELEPELICAIIEAESNGRNLIGKKNKNGTRDYGFMQTNEVHCPENPLKLLEINFGIHKGTNYLMWAYKKAKGNIKITAQFYNGGLNHPINTKNKWVKKYANKVVKYYNLSKITTNNKSNYLITTL